MEIDNMPLKDLRDLRAKVDRAINTFEDRRKREAISAVEEAAKAHGFNLAQLTGGKGKASQTVAPKYAHPENSSLTWTGRGRKPKWVVEALEAGKSLEDLSI